MKLVAGLLIALIELLAQAGVSLCMYGDCTCFAHVGVLDVPPVYIESAICVCCDMTVFALCLYAAFLCSQHF
jgi:hypothetical protein